MNSIRYRRNMLTHAVDLWEGWLAEYIVYESKKPTISKWPLKLIKRIKQLWITN